MTAPTRPAGNRWYDQAPRLSAAVETILSLPEALQKIVCQAVVLMADKEFQASERIQNFKSLGPDRILAFFKSKGKKRVYDHAPQAHKALNYLGLLSEEDRQFMADSVLELMALIQGYLRACRQHEQEPSAEQVERLSETYALAGKAGADQALRRIEQELLERVRNQPPTPSQLGESEEGLRLKNRARAIQT